MLETGKGLLQRKTLGFLPAFLFSHKNPFWIFMTASPRGKRLRLRRKERKQQFIRYWVLTKQKRCVKIFKLNAQRAQDLRV